MAPVGRPRIKGKGAKPKQFKRVAVSYAYKLQVLRFLDHSSMAQTITNFFPEVAAEKGKAKKRLLYSWKAVREVIEAKCANGAREHSRARQKGMGTTLSASSEEQLVAWINDLRRDGAPVTSLMLKLQAIDIYRASGGALDTFKASWCWRKHFLRRHKLSIRRRTRAGQTTPQDAEVKATEFAAAVSRKIQELKITTVYNADQTAVNYEYIPTSTIGKRGAKTVWVKCAGKSKERVTVMLLGRSDGFKAEPFLVFKTKPSTVEETARENIVLRHGFGRKLWADVRPLQTDVQIYGNQAGWWNSELSIAFLSYHFGRRPNMHEPILLLWDDFSGHWREDVLIFARMINVTLMCIPPGYTYTCQPADVAWNKPLKDQLRKCWVDFLLNQVRSLEPASHFKMAPPQRKDVVGWIKSAWAGLEATTIVNGFKGARLMGTQLASVELLSDTAEPDWESLVSLLQEMRIPIETVDPRNDIEELQQEDNEDE